ncbi:MAG TPA: hypothetical protein VHY75_17120 [Steroidobacteraceae bacterium]|nr:hypothetical protein [Steroidobacteraceae bacterium]
MALAVMAGCASRAPLTREILDEQSGNTLLVVTVPLEFARERNDVAAHARDYATLVAVEVDNAGKYGDYLLLYRWSTVDRRMSPPPDPGQGRLHIFADGRELDLAPLADLPVGPARLRELHLPPHGDPIVHAYPIAAETLRYIASSSELTVRMPQEPLDAPFLLREDGRAALRAFVTR